LAHLHAAVLEDQHVLDVGPRRELLIALPPRPYQRLCALRLEPGEGPVMVVGVDHDLGRPRRRLEAREEVVEDDDLIRREGDLGLWPARARRTQRAVILGRQERAVLAVDRVDDLLAAQLVEAPQAHARSGVAPRLGGSARSKRISARPSSLTIRRTSSGP